MSHYRIISVEPLLNPHNLSVSQDTVG